MHFAKQHEESDAQSAFVSSVPVLLAHRAKYHHVSDGDFQWLVDTAGVPLAIKTPQPLDLDGLEWNASGIRGGNYSSSSSGGGGGGGSVWALPEDCSACHRSNWGNFDPDGGVNFDSILWAFTVRD